MGSPLLVRTAKGVYPTAEGKLLYTYLEQALGLIQAAEENIIRWYTWRWESLRIGASDTVIANFLLPYLEKYHKLYPDIKLR